MKRSLVATGILCFILLAGAFNWSGCSAKKAGATSPQENQVDNPPVPPFITELRESIKGREDLPAEEVFQNIETLKGVPAGRLIAIMQFGYSNSLGVKCNHCHVKGDWADDSNPNKDIAREMSRMTRKINQDLLKGIKNLKSERPVINCTTCHRGQTKPALNMQ